MTRALRTILAGTALALVAIAAPTLGSASAAKPVSSTITVTDGMYGGTAQATVVTPRTDAEVFVQCYTPTYVYAAIFPVVDGQSTLGPLWATTWATPSAASCTVELGYVTRDGWGKWRVLATGSFNVTV